MKAIAVERIVDRRWSTTGLWRNHRNRPGRDGCGENTLPSRYHNGPVPVGHPKISRRRFIARAALGLGKLPRLSQDMGIQRFLHSSTLLFHSIWLLGGRIAARTYFEQGQVGTMPGGEEDGGVGAISCHLISCHPVPWFIRQAMNSLFSHVSRMMHSTRQDFGSMAHRCGRNSTTPYPRVGSRTADRSHRPPGNSGGLAGKGSIGRGNLSAAIVSPSAAERRLDMLGLWLSHHGCHLVHEPFGPAATGMPLARMGSSAMIAQLHGLCKLIC